MKVQNELIPESVLLPALPFLPDRKAILFDIETTGLSHRRSHLYLIGAIFCDGENWILRQWFLEKPAEEESLLRQFSQFLEEKKPSCLIHYNGDSFDLPWLRDRYAYYALPPLPDSPQSIDLYRIIRPYKKMLGLSSIRQKDLEQYLNVKREDTRDGGELIRVYQEYLRTASGELLRLLLLHNHDDLTGLLGILPILSVPRFFEGAFTVAGETFNPENSCTEFTLQAETPLPVSFLIDSGHVRLSGSSGDSHCVMTIAALQDTMLHFFPDYRNYWYLPEEDQAIHKSVAVYVDKAYRVKATASNCYQKAAGFFLPQPEEIIQPSFRRSFDDKDYWLRLNDGKFPEPELRKAYLATILKSLA